MKRVQGSEGLPLVECINPRLRKYRVRWDVQPYTEEEGEEHGHPHGGVTFVEHEFLHKPTMSEVKEVVLAGYNETIDETILSGFTWNGMLVWLSEENRFNYKAAYDLAVQTGGMNLPIVFKFGTTEEPKYHTFATVDELTEFYLAAMKHINDTLAAGWVLKDSIDWSEYERLLNG